MKYVAFLRGINVGGHTVKKEQFIEIFSSLGFKNIKTVIASGNIIFETEKKDLATIRFLLEKELAKVLGYQVITIIRSAPQIQKLIEADPFKNSEVTKSKSLYVTFLTEKTTSTFKLPYQSADKSFQISASNGNEVFSLLILEEPGKTPEVMKVLEKEYGKSSTTRNWNTIEKIANILTN